MEHVFVFFLVQENRDNARFRVEAEAELISVRNTVSADCGSANSVPKKKLFWACLADKSQSECTGTQAQLHAITSSEIALLSLICIRVQLEPGNY